jgi:hypothetical protein
MEKYADMDMLVMAKLHGCVKSEIAQGQCG